MYCVKCGVKLENSSDCCPLCGTPVWNPDGNIRKESIYSDELPPKEGNPKRALVILLTVLSLAALFAVGVVALNLPEKNDWAGYALLGILLGYIVLVLPLWFKRNWPEIFVPVTHVATAGYLLYVCCTTGGKWFMTFAFPLVGMSCILLTTGSVLLKYIRRNRGYIVGGGLIAAGGFSILAEFFAHITFGAPMFRWSIYSCGACFVIGMFIILVEIIKPMKAFFKRNFFF